MSTSADEPLAQMIGVSFNYEEEELLLQAISLEVRAGEVAFIVGESGVGKTTLLSFFSIARRPQEGVVRLFGHATHQLDRSTVQRLRRRIGIVFQGNRLLEHLSAFDNIALPLRLAGKDEGAIAGYVSRMMAWFRLSHRLEARPGELSLGEQKIVAIARAVVGNPALVLADEPLSHLDDERASQVVQLIQQLARRRCAVVVTAPTSWRMHGVEHRVLALRDGSLTASGEAPDRRARPAVGA